MKRKQVTCNCPARDYPHRLDEPLCRMLYNADISEDYKAGLLRDFERSESQAYNKELSIFEVRF